MRDMFLSVSVCVVGLLLVAGFRLTLRRFVPLYGALVVVSSLMTATLMPGGSRWVVVLATGVAGFVLVVAAAGLAGKKIASGDYSAMLALFGLFPWYLGFVPGGAVIVMSLLMLAGAGLVARQVAWRKLGHHTMVPGRVMAKSVLSGDDYTKLLAASKVSFALPLAAAVVVSSLLVAL